MLSSGEWADYSHKMTDLLQSMQLCVISLPEQFVHIPKILIKKHAIARFLARMVGHMNTVDRS